MCAPRKPVDIAGALASLTAIADALSVAGASVDSLLSASTYGRRWTRSVRRVTVLTHGLVAESRCAVPREEP